MIGGGFEAGVNGKARYFPHRIIDQAWHRGKKRNANGFCLLPVHTSNTLIIWTENKLYECSWADFLHVVTLSCFTACG